MSIIHALLQCIKNPTSYTKIRICVDSNLCRNLISSLKSNPRNMIRQLIRILLNRAPRVVQRRRCKQVHARVVRMAEHALRRAYHQARGRGQNGAAGGGAQVASGGALVSSAPTEQAAPQHSTTYANNAKDTICYVGALETSAPPYTFIKKML